MKDDMAMDTDKEGLQRRQGQVRQEDWEKIPFQGSALLRWTPASYGTAAEGKGCWGQ